MFTVQKLPTMVDPRSEFSVNESGTCVTSKSFSTEEEAVDFALTFTGLKPVKKITCSVSMAYRVLGYGELKIVDFEHIEVTSKEEAEATAQQLVDGWFQNRPDVWNAIKTLDGEPKKYEIKVRPID